MKKLLFFVLFAVSNLAYSACTTTITGGNLATALNSVAAGGTVCLNAGTYTWPEGTVVNKSSMTFVEPAEGVARSSVIINSIIIRNSRNITFNNLTFNGLVIGYIGNASATNISVLNSTFTTQEGLYIAAYEAINHNILIQGNTFGNVPAMYFEGRLSVRGWLSPVNQGIVINNNIFDGPGPSDGIHLADGANGVVISNNEFRNIKQNPVCTAAANVHCDPIQFFGGNNTVVTGNYFHDNSTGIMGNGDDGPMTLTNNLFVTDGEYPNQIVRAQISGDVITHNTFACGARMRFGDTFGTSTNATIRNNIFLAFDFQNGQTQGGLVSGGGVIEYNLISGSAIGTGGISGTPTYTGGTCPTTRAGFQLAAGSLGKNAASDGLDMGATSFGTDTTAPTVSSTVPATNATNVSVSANITAIFSEALSSGTVTTTTASIKRTSDNAPVTSAVSYASNVITINPSSDLANSTQYTVTLTTGIQDAAGNALATTYTWNFTTAAATDTTPPTVTGRVPAAANAIDISPTAAVTITFNEDLDPATVSSSTVELKNTLTNAVVTSTITYNSGLRRIILTPNSPLATETQYTMLARGGASDPRVKDVAGNALAGNYQWSFTTSEYAFTPPTGVVFRLDFEPSCPYCDGISLNDATSASQATLPTLNASGKVGYAASFDGSNDYLSARLKTTDFVADTYSISLWVNPTTETLKSSRLTVNEILQAVDVTLFRRGLVMLSQKASISSRYSFNMSFDNTKTVNAGILQQNAWNHIVVTYGLNKEKIYVNNVLVATATRSKPMISKFNSIKIGVNAKSQYFSGLMDSLMIFNTELNQAAVTSLYNQSAY